MAPKVLESQLVISGRDKTGALFDTIGRKFDRLFRAGRRMDTVGRDFLRVGAAVDNAGRKVDALHTKMQRLNKLFERRLGGAAGLTRGLGFGIASMSVYELASKAAEKAVQATVQGQHERVRMETAGMAPEEMREAELTAAKLSAEVMPLSQTTLLHMLRNARSIVGSFDEAAKVIEPLARLRVVAAGAHPERAEELEGDFDALIKGMEIKGVTQDLPRFTHYIDNMAKALNVFGDTLRPTDYYEMFKYGRAATQSLSDRFMLMTAPTFAQEMGGSSAGKAFSTFYANIVGGRLRAQAANELNKLGLIDPSKVKISKAGIVTRVQPGAVTGAALAAADPYRWVNEILLPALARHGITDKEKIGAEIASVFRDQTAAQLVNILATQQSRIQKDWRLVEHAAGIGAADTFMHKDIMTSWHGVDEQLTNLMQTLGSPLAAPAATNLNRLAAGISSLTTALQAGPPKLADAGFAKTAEWYIDVLHKLTLPLRWLTPGGQMSFAAGELSRYAFGQLSGSSSAPIESVGATAIPAPMPAWLENVAGASTAWGAAPAAPELKGDAKLDVHITIDHDGGAHLDTHVDNRIGGVKIGTTGDLGQSWADVVPGL